MHIWDYSFPDSVDKGTRCRAHTSNGGAVRNTMIRIIIRIAPESHTWLRCPKPENFTENRPRSGVFLWQRQGAWPSLQQFD